jgi:hypothetical protein
LDDLTIDPFTVSDLERIATILCLPEGPKRRWLERKLRQLPDEIRILRSRDAIPRPAEVRKQLVRIEDACVRYGTKPPHEAGARLEKLLDHIGETARSLILWQFALCEDPERPERALDDGRAQNALSSALSDPGLLRSAASSATQNLEREIRLGRGGPRHKADWVLQQILLNLATFYFELRAEPPGISTDPETGRPSGRFLEFLKICLPVLGWELSPDAIRYHFRAARVEAKVGRPAGATDIFD